MPRQVIIVGAGAQGQVVADILLAAQPASEIELIGYVDDNTSLRGESFLGVPVLGSIADLPHLDHQGVIIAIGNTLGGTASSTGRNVCNRYPFHRYFRHRG